jgi:hypothetical protein
MHTMNIEFRRDNHDLIARGRLSTGLYSEVKVNQEDIDAAVRILADRLSRVVMEEVRAEQIWCGDTKKPAEAG